MDEVAVTNILKRYSDKKTEGVIKSPEFLFSVAIRSHLAHSWPGLNYMCKAKYQTLGNGEMHYNYFSITTTCTFLKDLFFVSVLFVLIAIYISVSLLGNR